ncbi:hypothetical protein K431DRAFT_59083 [Polychaeton citri CBS 116435]|uniref:Uncharacterized protein n=1 Tax=Polychaeton citri CBS 116435 TaxID=1314669 RepID=A0A9P4Q7I2_9PEZI|nr:hypothetical protein K431DRAFT_59083 [Polychaeton citri CBS 116435]
MDRPWVDDERNELLSEIIKAAHVPPIALLDVIRRYNLTVSWDNVPLPRGRTVAGCRNEFERMRQSVPPTSYGPMTIQPQLKRSFDQPSMYSPHPGTRAIQPKPPTMYAGQQSQPSPTEPPPKRKRGRPTKQEAEARAAAAAAAAQQAASTSGGAAQIRTQGTTPAPPMSPVPFDPARSFAPDPPAPPTPTAPPTTRMPISQIIETPVRTTSNPSTSSSSGRRRRGRSSRSTDDQPSSAPPAVGHSYESPYGATFEPDTPAKTAAMRHREEFRPGSRPGPSSDPR